jgi:hypothetical protein
VLSCYWCRAARDARHLCHWTASPGLPAASAAARGLPGWLGFWELGGLVVFAGRFLAGAFDGVALAEVVGQPGPAVLALAHDWPPRVVAKRGDSYRKMGEPIRRAENR